MPFNFSHFCIFDTVGCLSAFFGHKKESCDLLLAKHFKNRFLHACHHWDNKHDIDLTMLTKTRWHKMYPPTLCVVCARLFNIFIIHFYPLFKLFFVQHFLFYYFVFILFYYFIVILVQR